MIVDVGFAHRFPWGFPSMLFSRDQIARAPPGVLHGLPQTGRKCAWIGAGQGPAGREIHLAFLWNDPQETWWTGKNAVIFQAFQWSWMALNGTILGLCRSEIFHGNIYFMGNMITVFFLLSLTRWQRFHIRWQDQQWLIRSQGKFQNFVETELSQINEAATRDWERVSLWPGLWIWWKIRRSLKGLPIGRYWKILKSWLLNVLM